MSKKALTVLSNIFEKEDQHLLRSKMLLALSESVQTTFSEQTYRMIRSSIKKTGKLDEVTSNIVSSTLDEAKLNGNLTVEAFRALYQFYSFVRKAPESGDEDICLQNGLQKLLKGEEKCLVTNMTLESRIRENFSFFDRVKRIIEEILGPVPSNFLTSNTEVFFGPGSTVNQDSRSFSETAEFFKLSDKLVIPEKAKFYLAAHVSAHPNWVDALASHYRTQQNPGESRLDLERRVFDKHFVIVPNDNPSRIGFVPKNSDEHRAIGIEMNGLVPLQKVVGDLIRQRLHRRAGINLDSQDRNRHLARLAKTFDLATIDLANASSSISKDLVRAIVPYDWWCLFSDFRSECGFEPKTQTLVEYEMISSMGNGFTFELESLIFYAVAKATAEEVGISAYEQRRGISIFGDDIIIPRRCCEQLFKRLTLFGFTANIEKSFTKGFFFESCGADYYDGHDVRPFFLKRDICTIRDVYFLLNSLLFKIVEKDSTNLMCLYRYLFKQLNRKSEQLLKQRCHRGNKNFKVELGPLHFSPGSYGRLSTDDLESVLRVPLDYAQANGGVKFDTRLHAWVYKRWVRVSVEAPISKMPCYFVRSFRYMTFLRGQREGKVVLRGRTRATLKPAETSSWDGLLGIKELRNVKYLFDTLAY